MRNHLSPKASRLFGALLFSGALLLGTAFPASSQPPDETLRVVATKTTITGISPETDSLRIATADGALNLWIASSKFVKEERGLSLADLKIGDGLSEAHGKNFDFVMNENSLPLASLSPFVLERKAATDPDQIFPSTPGFAPSVSAGREGTYLFRLVDNALQTTYKNDGETSATIAITKPDYLPIASTVKYGEPGDGVVMTVLKPETMTFTRSTRIELSDLAVGQVVSVNIAIEPDGRAVCHLLKVIIDK